MLISYGQNSAAHRFMSLNDFFICESRDAKLFESIFPLKKNVSTDVHETIPIHGNVSMPAHSLAVRRSIDEPRQSKRHRVQSSFGPDLLTTFFIKDFDVNFLTNELVSAFFIKEDPKTFVKAVRSIDACI